jgi:hypothetical protein
VHECTLCALSLASIPARRKARREDKPVVAIRTTRLLLYAPETPRRLHLPLGVVATDLATEHGGTDVNKRDVARQVGRLNVAHLQL